MTRQFINTTDGVTRVWDVARLWELAKELPVKAVPIRDISALDEVTWFGEGPDGHPTCRRGAEHARRIYAADLDVPVILSCAGWVMDGMHRICKAYLTGREEIQAVQFPQDPEPDEIRRTSQ